MEKIKDPAMLLSIANSIGLVGTTTYFYKQLESMRTDMVKISQTLGGVIRKMSELEKTDQHKTESLHSLNDQIKNISTALDDISTPSMNEDLDLDLNEIIVVLEEHNIVVERPSQNIKPYRSGDRRGNSRRDVDHEEKRETSRRPVGRATDSRAPVRSSTRDSFREPVKELVREPARNKRPEAVTYDEDNDDLIGAVRSQGGH